MPKLLAVLFKGLFRCAPAGLAFAMTLSGPSALAQSAQPVAVSGKPDLMLGAYDLAPLGYQVEEYFLSGTATSHSLPGVPSADGAWNAVPAATAPYTTRFVVIRPSDPARFNGTLLVEWLNVTAGQDTPADWMVAHREMLRRGYAWVGVSAQKVGVEGGTTAMGQQGAPLKKTNPARYANLSHPGDAFSFDIYSQVGTALKAAQGRGALGPLVPRRVLAIGESQSAAFLTTYVNAADPLAKVYDGFLIHSRFGSSASLDGTPMRGAAANYPDHVRFRRDLRVPVLTFISETDLLGARLSGYHGSRRPDDRHLRVWEVAGTAHADNYLFMGAFIDSGSLSAAELAKVFRPATTSMAGKVEKPFNEGMPHHYVMHAALAALDRWVRSGRPPASTQPLMLTSGAGTSEAANLALDAHGIARGGVRTPWVDVPTIRLSGKGDPNSFIGMLAGSGEPFDKVTLDRLYPGGKADYLGKFTRSLDAAIRRGHLLREDRQEILDIAAINFDAGPVTAPGH
ncbi:MAG: alpha/beta hydrolase domain-containing protein [Novosphingobium sp.]